MILSSPRSEYGPKYFFLNKSYPSLQSLPSDVFLPLNENAINFFLKYGYFPNGETVFFGARRLFPKYFTVKSTSSETTHGISIMSCKKKILEILSSILSKSEAKNHAVFFTGGVDSSLIVGILKQLGKKVITHCGAFEGSHKSFLKKANDAAKILKTKHNNYIFSFKTLAQVWPEVIDNMQEPVYDMDLPAVYLMLENMRSTAEICHSGMGCDDLFGLKRRTFEKYFISKILPELFIHDQLTEYLSAPKFSFPYLDKKFIAYISNLPFSLRVRNQTEKFPLRMAANEILPKKLPCNKKSTICFPFLWIKALALYFKDDVYRNNYLKTQWLKARKDDFEGNNKYVFLFRAVILARWLRKVKQKFGSLH